jgi:hypothetical protein
MMQKRERSEAGTTLLRTALQWRGRRSPQGRRKISSVAAGMAIHNAGADVVARLADLATNDDHSPLFGAPGAT